MQAADWAQWIEPLADEGDWPHRQLRLGFDTNARLLETRRPRLREWARAGDPCDAGSEAVLGALALTAGEQLSLESGYFDRSLHTYGQEGRPRERCATPIVRDHFMNRSSFFGPRCQPPP